MKNCGLWTMNDELWIAYFLFIVHRSLYIVNHSPICIPQLNQTTPAFKRS